MREGRRHRRHQLGVAAACFGIAALAAACGASGAPGATPNPGGGAGGGASSGGPATSTAGTLNLALGGPHNPVTQNFNPFLPTSTLNDVMATSMVYEPLLQFDTARNPTEQPWLATSYSWADNDKKLTFHLRHGVKWSDGKPFTSADVVFTFDLIKKYSALNDNGIKFSSVTAPDPYTVRFTFASPAGPELYYIGGLTYVVPKHLWSGVKNPTNYADTKPVGTGPYLLKGISTGLDDVTFVKNPSYWQPGKPAVKALRFNVYNSNTGVNQALQDNADDWGSAAPTKQIIKAFLSSSPDHHFSNVSIPQISYLYPNLQKYPTNILAVRQAINDVINRQIIATVGESGLFTAATSPTGLALPLQKSYLAPPYAHLHYKVDVAAAKKTLEAAGFTMGRNGIFTKGGKPLDITLITPGGYTDYVSDAQIMQQELKAAGISMSIDTTSVGAFTAALDDGNFSVTLEAPTYGPTPYYSLNAILNTTLGAPIGKQATGDQERWTDSSTDKLLQTAAEGGPAGKKAYAQLEKIMVTQLPALAVVVRSSDAQDNTSHFTGFPTATSNQWDGSVPDLEQAMLGIRPK